MRFRDQSLRPRGQVTAVPDSERSRHEPYVSHSSESWRSQTANVLNGQRGCTIISNWFTECKVMAMLADSEHDGIGIGSKLGRPEDPEIVGRVYHAVLDLLVDKGYDRLTIGAIAEMSSVSRPTIYSRWGGKVEVVVAALAALSPPLVEQTDLAGGEALMEMAIDFLVAFTGWKGASSVLALHALSGSDPELSKRMSEIYWTPRERTLVAAIDRAMGPSNAERISTDDIRDHLFGPGIYRFLIMGTPLDEATARALVEASEKTFLAK